MSEAFSDSPVATIAVMLTAFYILDSVSFVWFAVTWVQWLRPSWFFTAPLLESDCRKALTRANQLGLSRYTGFHQLVAFNNFNILVKTILSMVLVRFVVRTCEKEDECAYQATAVILLCVSCVARNLAFMLIHNRHWWKRALEALLVDAVLCLAATYCVVRVAVIAFKMHEITKPSDVASDMLLQQSVLVAWVTTYKMFILLPAWHALQIGQLGLDVEAANKKED